VKIYIFTINVRFVSGYWMVRYSNSIRTRDKFVCFLMVRYSDNHYSLAKTALLIQNCIYVPFINKTVYASTIRKPDKSCRTGHPNTGPFEKWTQKVAGKWPFKNRTVWYSNHYCTTISTILFLFHKQLKAILKLVLTSLVYQTHVKANHLR
jgi:hypothetical protein